MIDTPTILITGAASGIGAATARALAQPGARMLLHTKSNRAGIEKVAADVEAGGVHTVLAMGDLAARETGAALLATAIDAFGSLDILVSNAGFPTCAP